MQCSYSVCDAVVAVAVHMSAMQVGHSLDEALMFAKLSAALDSASASNSNSNSASAAASRLHVSPQTSFNGRHSLTRAFAFMPKLSRPNSWQLIVINLHKSPITSPVDSQPN